jgi:hypothetical protein
MEIVGPFSKATRKRQFILVAIDYFTKRVKAEALANITTNKVLSFF